MLENSYDDTPYLANGHMCKSYLQFKRKTSELIEKYFENSDDSLVSQSSLAFAKIFKFDDFSKFLKVKDIIHSVCLMYNELLKVCT